MNMGLFVGFKKLMEDGIVFSFVIICNDMKVLEEYGLLVKIYFFLG